MKFYMLFFFFFFFKQKTAYEITTGDWSSDVCSFRSTIRLRHPLRGRGEGRQKPACVREIGRASCRKECRLLCRSRWSPYHSKKNTGDAQLALGGYIDTALGSRPEMGDLVFFFSSRRRHTR